MALDTVEFRNDQDVLLYTITLDSAECVEGKQTWTYTVTESGEGQDISNWALQLCPDVMVLEPTDPPGAIIEDPNQDQGQGNCLNINNPISCDVSVENQIKWEVSDEFITGTFTFMLDKCYECEEVHVAIKAGNECFCGIILGPSPICTECECPPVTRGILFI